MKPELLLACLGSTLVILWLLLWVLIPGIKLMLQGG